MNQESDDMQLEAFSSVMDSLPNPQKFSIMIENLSRNNKTDYIDTIINYCEEHDMDFDTVAKLLNPTIKDKIRIEFSEKRNMLPRVAKLKKC